MFDDSDTREFARLAEALKAAATPAATAGEIVEYVRGQLDATLVGLTLIRPEDRLETIAATDPLAEEADRLERELDDGPRHDDSWAEGTLVSSELAYEGRWPQWASAVADLGIVSVLVAELSNLDNRRIGSINIYSTRLREFTADDVAFADILAHYAAYTLSQSMAEETLNAALDSRALVGQAQGILMERYGLDEPRAFDVLRRYSQVHDVDLRTAAADLIAVPTPPRLRASRGGRG